jgi:hypothetical protein
MLDIDDVLDILSTPLLGIIPESQDVLHASNVGSPTRPITPRSLQHVPMSTPHDGSGVMLYRWPFATNVKACSTSCFGGESGMSFFNRFQAGLDPPVRNNRVTA